MNFLIIFLWAIGGPEIIILLFIIGLVVSLLYIFLKAKPHEKKNKEVLEDFHVRKNPQQHFTKSDILFELIKEFAGKGNITPSEMDLIKTQAKGLELSEEELKVLISEAINEKK